MRYFAMLTISAVVLLSTGALPAEETPAKDQKPTVYNLKPAYKPGEKLFAALDIRSVAGAKGAKPIDILQNTELQVDVAKGSSGVNLSCSMHRLAIAIKNPTGRYMQADTARPKTLSGDMGQAVKMYKTWAFDAVLAEGRKLVSFKGKGKWYDMLTKRVPPEQMAQMLPMLTGPYEDMFKSQWAYIPSKPVKVGDTWSVQRTTFAVPMVAGLPPTGEKVTCKLIGVKVTKRGSVAEIAIEGTVGISGGFGPTTAKRTGTAKFNLTTGKTEKLELLSQCKFSDGQTVTVKATLTLSDAARKIQPESTSRPAPKDLPAGMFNSKLNLYVYAEEMYPDGSIGAKMFGETPSYKPIALPRGAKWWVSPANSSIEDTGLRAICKEIGDRNIPGLKLSFCDDITDAGLAHLKGLTKLEKLDISHCDNITDAGLAHLKGLTKLERLDISFNAITDAGLAHLKGLTKLERLELNASEKITDAGLAHLKGMAKLERLNLYHCVKITDAGLAHLKGLTTLKQLNITRCDSITNAGVAHLKGLAKLERLDIAGDEITDAGLAHLKGLAKLERLDITGDEITDAGLAHLKGLTTLKWLDLSHCDKITDAGLAHLKGLTKLDYIDLANCDRITDAGLAHLKGLAKLERLKLYHCVKITDAGLAHLKGLTTLERLDLSYCNKITDAGLADLKGLTTLKQLDLNGCDNIHAAGLAHLKGLTKLEQLNLSECDNITDAGLAHLKGLTKLEKLNLTYCGKVTTAGIAELKKALPNLTVTKYR
jgi:Leucine-rich repeat (LRR) protein